MTFAAVAVSAGGGCRVAEDAASLEACESAQTINSTSLSFINTLWFPARFIAKAATKLTWGKTKDTTRQPVTECN